MQKGRGGEAEAPRQKRVEVETGQARRLLRRSLGEDESEGVQADWIGLVMAGGQRNGEGEENRWGKFGRQGRLAALGFVDFEACLEGGKRVLQRPAGAALCCTPVGWQRWLAPRLLARLGLLQQLPWLPWTPCGSLWHLLGLTAPGQLRAWTANWFIVKLAGRGGAAARELSTSPRASSIMAPLSNDDPWVHVFLYRTTLILGQFRFRI